MLAISLFLPILLSMGTPAYGAVERGDGARPVGNAHVSPSVFAEQECGSSVYHTLPAGTPLNGSGATFNLALDDALMAASGATCPIEVCFGLDCLLSITHEQTLNITGEFTTNPDGTKSFRGSVKAGGVTFWTHCDC